MIAKPHILIVEDEFASYQELYDLLSSEGYEVSDYTPSYDDAIQSIKKHKPDLVLLDIQLLGDKSGLDVGNELHTKYNIPFIYITGLDDRNTFNKALQTGHEIFMAKTKPVLEEKTLRRHIETVLNKGQSVTVAEKQPVGINGLVDYLENLQKKGHKTISSVQVRFSEIVLFSKDDFLNVNEEKEPVKPNYIWFLTEKDDIFFIKKSLKKISEITPDNFVRISGKYIINFDSISYKGRINGSKIQIKDFILQITDTYKEQFNKIISEKYID